MLRVSLKLPTLSPGVALPVELRVEVQSCRPRGGRWTVGVHLVGCSDEARREIVAYCYLVSQRERLRGPQPIALPAPVEVEPLSLRAAV